MRTHLARRTAAVVVFFLGGALCAAQQKDYEIKLHRNAVVGEKHLLVASASQSQTMVMTMDGQPGPSQDMSMTAELTAHITTLAVTAAGKESKMSLAIDKSKCSADGMTSEIVPAGTTVFAARDTETVTYTVGDLPLNARATKCLGLVVPLSPTDQATDDLVFGTKARQKVGSAWAMNSAAAAEDFSKSTGLSVSDKNFSGSTKLVEVTPFNDRPALRLSGEMVMTNVGVPLPPGMAVKTSEFKATLSALLPIDLTRNDGQMGMSMTGRVECDGETAGHKLHLLMIMDRRMDQTLTIES